MRVGVRAARFGLCLLTACAADVVSVGAWVDGKPTLDATPEPTLDATPNPTSDASTPPLEPGGYIEAEQGELSAGFSVGADEAASGGKFLTAVEASTAQDVPGNARARYVLDIRADGEYVLWGRIHAQDERHNRFWFQIDGGTWYLWRLSTGDVWFWDDLHHDTSYTQPVRFMLSKGAHELMLANATRAVQLDRLYFTAAGDEPPGNDTPCRPPNSIEIAGQCVPSCGSLGGTVCGATVCSGRTLLNAYDCDVCCRL